MNRIIALLVAIFSLLPAAWAEDGIVIPAPTRPTAPTPPQMPGLPDGSTGTHVSGVTVHSSGGGSATANIGGIGSGASVEGIAVINGDVFVDGEKVPVGVTRFTSKRGQKYRIERDHGSVRVDTE